MVMRLKQRPLGCSQMQDGSPWVAHARCSNLETPSAGACKYGLLCLPVGTSMRLGSPGEKDWEAKASLSIAMEFLTWSPRLTLGFWVWGNSIGRVLLPFQDEAVTDFVFHSPDFPRWLFPKAGFLVGTLEVDKCQMLPSEATTQKTHIWGRGCMPNIGGPSIKGKRDGGKNSHRVRRVGDRPLVHGWGSSPGASLPLYSSW